MRHFNKVSQEHKVLKSSADECERLKSLVDQERQQKEDLALAKRQAEEDRERALMEKQDAIDNAKAIAERKLDAQFRESMKGFNQVVDYFRSHDDTEEPLAKKMREEKREFLLNGEKAVPGKFTKMQLSGLLNLSSVDARAREKKIGRDEFVEIQNIIKNDDLVSRTGDQNDSQNKTQIPKTRPEFFQALYGFGQYYLQCYPEKSVAFLEYLAYMNKYGAILSSGHVGAFGCEY